MKLGILFPMAAELGDLAEGMRHEKRLCYDFYAGTLAGKEVTLAVCGVGKVNAALVAGLLLAQGVDALLVCGVAGAIAPQLVIGDTVVSTETAHHDLPEDMIEGDSLNNIPHLPSIWMPAGAALLSAARSALAHSPHNKSVSFGRVVSGEVFIGRDGREPIIARLDPLAADMETAAVAQACFVYQTPYLALRSITDTGEQCGLEVYRAHLAEAAANSRAALLALLAVL